MYTVLLADDENSMLEMLRDSIAWHQFGVDNVLTANDGIQALEKIRQQQVDLLITDIRMPHMDGLTLIRTLRQEYPHVHSILLTAHSEFEYARQAVRLGVENYLLKPLNRAELEDTIEKALDNLYIQRGHREREKRDSLFRDNILVRWLNNAISQEELAERASFLDLNLYAPKYCVVVVQKKIGDISVRPFCNELLKKFSTQCDTYFLWDMRRYHVFILGGQALDAEFVLRCFWDMVPSYAVASHVALCVGEIVHSAADVFISYQTACRRLDAANTSSTDPVSLVCAQGESVRQEAVFVSVSNVINAPDSETRRSQTRELLNRLTLTGITAETYALLCSALMRLFTQRFPEKKEPCHRLASRLRMSGIHAPEEWEDLIDFTYLLYQHTLNEFSPVVHRAVSYIQENYDKQLSIKEYCAMCKMSTPYFGHLFKTETGMFFNNYLNQCRMCAAIALLNDTNLKLDDIAQRCGFSSSNYFITCFKKQTGLSPNKYRSQHNANPEG